MLFSIPFIRNLRDNFPESYIASLIPKRCSEILQDCPYLNEIIYFNERTTHRGLWKKIKFIVELRKKRFDMAILLHRSLSRTMICYLAGIKQRIGYYSRKRGWLLTKAISPLPKDSLHRIDYHLGILKGMGLKVSSGSYEFFLNDDQRGSLAEKLKGLGLRLTEQLVVLHPGANEPIRRWPVESFARLAEKISAEFGLKVVISGSQADIPIGRRIVELSSVQLINLCGKTSLKELAALFEKALFVVGGDTGPIHIAAAVGVPVICLFGTASVKITRPMGKGRSIILHKDIGCAIPCLRIDCADNRCMKAIGVDEVFQAVGRVVNEGK